MGAVDVVPFIPIEGASMKDCIALARDVGKAVAERFEVPIFLYEEAASGAASEEPRRREAGPVRRPRREAEGRRLGPGLRTAQPRIPPRERAPWAPACPSSPTTSISEPGDVEIAKKIAKGIRHSSGGFRFVKAMGLMLEERGIAQVSINMTDFKKTPLHRVFETVRNEAARYGVNVVGSEIVGLVPSEALLDAADHFLRLERFDLSQILERKIAEAE